MQDYIVPWTDLEVVTGLQFFPTLVTEEWKERADYVTHETVLRFTAGKRGQQLMLTDGKSKKDAARSAGAATKTLQHLCKGGECR